VEDVNVQPRHGNPPVMAGLYAFPSKNLGGKPGNGLTELVHYRKPSRLLQLGNFRLHL
jgi:hypothetical protein